MNRRDVLRMTLASAGLGGTAARTLMADEKRPELPVPHRGNCDSGRADVQYETGHGRKLDRAMVELLQAF